LNGSATGEKMTSDPGLPDFCWHNLPKTWKIYICTKCPQNIPHFRKTWLNCHKNSQNFISRPSKIYQNLDLLYNNNLVYFVVRYLV
jgi:hypothetical protein